MDNTNEIILPETICLNQFQGNYNEYVIALYKIFINDFVEKKVVFRNEEIKLKWHPKFQDRAYTFYHITHKGEDENNREPDFDRCERLPWAKPTIENCDAWNLKIWPQVRKSKNRLCIWLELEGEPDYFVILEIRESFKLFWTAFVAKYPHEKRKKMKEYSEWKKMQKPLGDT